MKFTPTSPTKAEKAVLHIVDCAERYSGFARQMLDTETLNQCIKAVAEIRGEPEADIKSRIETKAAVPEIMRLQGEVDRLKREVLTVKGALSFRTRTALADLIRLAELGHDVLTVDNLREALGSKRKARK